jgi:hypothetical protein
LTGSYHEFMISDMTTYLKQPAKQGRGRPKLGDCRIECVVPQAVMNELIKREKQGQGYRTRVAANILCAELIGHVTQRDGSLHQI